VLTSIALEQKKNSGPQEIGRSVGGLSTKIHALADALGNPIGFALSPGSAHDLTGADLLLPNLKSCKLLADKAYGSDDRVITPLENKGIEAVIPSKKNALNPRAIDKHLYQARHLIENFFARLKQYRAIATRYDKLARNFLGGIYLAAIMVWLN
jgi:transposase